MRVLASDSSIKRATVLPSRLNKARWTENVGVDNAGASKMLQWKMQNGSIGTILQGWKMREKTVCTAKIQIT